MANSEIFYVEVPTSEDDLDPYRFYFTDKKERDRFADALTGYRDSSGYEMINVEHDLLYRSADDAIAKVKEYLGWSELPEADPDDDSDED